MQDFLTVLIEAIALGGALYIGVGFGFAIVACAKGQRRDRKVCEMFPVEESVKPPMPQCEEVTAEELSQEMLLVVKESIAVPVVEVIEQEVIESEAPFYPVRELRKMARAAGVRGFKKLKRSELLEVLALA
jgi:hypothetical protein